MKLTRARLFLALAAVAIVVGTADLWIASLTGAGVDQERVNSWALADEARARVQVGMTLQEAEALLSDAWHHAVCRYGSYDPERGESHVFLFGSRGLDKTGIVILRVKGPIDDRIVSSVGFVDNYRLVPSYSCCLRRSGLQVDGCES